MKVVKGLQPVWERSIIDENQTTADFLVATPVKKEVVFLPDRPWETKMAHYANVIYSDGKYRMYYITHLANSMKKEYADGRDGELNEILDLYVCYAESEDGLHWIKPNLGIHEYEGSKENNIILRSIDKPEYWGHFDNFFVFIDTNPNCAPEKRYKAIAMMWRHKVAGYYSSDGIHWELDSYLDAQCMFDSLNVCWWDERINKYVLYARGFHNVPEDGNLEFGLRDIKRFESEDFYHWSAPELVTFPNSEDCHMYTNNIMRYYRNRDIYVGFPTRYLYRRAWTDNYEQLCSKEGRLEVMKKEARLGLAITDCVFMVSRDGVEFDKFDEALFTPGYEFESNWLYGNCYPVYFMLETPVGDGKNKEISMFVVQEYNCLTPKCMDTMERWTFRIDGFAYYNAKYRGAKVVTNPFVFEGDEFYINFSTSASGSMYVTMKDADGNAIKTCELFGDSVSRKVNFENANISQFSGKEVVLEFEMKDAKLYAFEFKHSVK